MKKKKRAQNSLRQEFEFEPICNLPLLTQSIDKGVRDAVKQEQVLREGRKMLHVFDDLLISSVKTVHMRQLEIIALSLEQIDRWKKETLTMDQHFELTHLNQECNRLKGLVTSILALCEEIGGKTINKIMAMDDAELGLKFLLGELS
jgi:hypothetical protein